MTDGVPVQQQLSVRVRPQLSMAPVSPWSHMPHRAQDTLARYKLSVRAARPGVVLTQLLAPCVVLSIKLTSTPAHAAAAEAAPADAVLMWYPGIHSHSPLYLGDGMSPLTFSLCVKYLWNRCADLRQIHMEDVFGPSLGRV